MEQSTEKPQKRTRAKKKGLVKSRIIGDGRKSMMEK